MAVVLAKSSMAVVLASTTVVLDLATHVIHALQAVELHTAIEVVTLPLSPPSCPAPCPRATLPACSRSWNGTAVHLRPVLELVLVTPDPPSAALAHHHRHPPPDMGGVGITCSLFREQDGD
jgi:hypothetical protein